MVLQNYLQTILDNIVINYSDHYVYSNYSDVYYKYSDLITESFMTY